MEAIYQQGVALLHKRSYAEAVSLFRQAAQAGYAPAQNALGNCYLEGNGVEKNAFTAVDWYTKAAEQGDITAINNLAGCYAAGEGAPHNPETALYWYNQAARLGDAYAANMADMLENDIREQKRQPKKLPRKTELDCNGTEIWETDGPVLIKYLGTHPRPTVPEHITVIGSEAFKDCGHLEAVTLPLGLKQIKSSAFCNCKALRQITIPGSVELVDQWAFRDCDGLEEVVLPESLQKLEIQAFAWAQNLKNVTLPGSLKRATHGLEYSLAEEVTFREGIAYIHMDMFWQNTRLKTLVVPDSLEKIEFGRNSPKHTISIRCSDRWARKHEAIFLWYCHNLRREKAE